MVVKFFMLQSHYRSTLDLTDEALAAAEKGYRRLMEANQTLQELAFTGTGDAGELDREIQAGIDRVYAEMNDDFNTPKALAALFELVTKVNSFKGGQLTMEGLTEPTFRGLQETFRAFIVNIFALEDELAGGGRNGQTEVLDGVMSMVLELRAQARANKDWGTADKIRDTLQAPECRRERRQGWLDLECRVIFLRLKRLKGLSDRRDVIALYLYCSML